MCVLIKCVYKSSAHLGIFASELTVSNRFQSCFSSIICNTERYFSFLSILIYFIARSRRLYFVNQIALKAVLPSVFITRPGGIKWVNDDLCKAAVRARCDVLFFFIFAQLCQCINACYLPTHSSSIRSVLVINVGLHWASATQWAVKSTLHAFSKHGSKPHIVVAGTVKMPVSLKKKVAEWYKHDNELWWHKRGGFIHTLCPSTIIAGHQWAQYLEHPFYGTHARRSCTQSRPYILFSYP